MPEKFRLLMRLLKYLAKRKENAGTGIEINFNAMEEEMDYSTLRGSISYHTPEAAVDPNLNEDVLNGQVGEAFSDSKKYNLFTYSNRSKLPYEFVNSAMPMIDQKFQPAQEKWAMLNAIKDLESIAKKYKNVSDKDVEVPEFKMTEEYYPSVKPYLELLPKEYREMPIIRELAVMMDKKWFNVPVEVKQDMLNFAVAMQLPLEDCKQG